MPSRWSMKPCRYHLSHPEESVRTWDDFRDAIITKVALTRFRNPPQSVVGLIGEMTWQPHQVTWHDMTCHVATNHSSSPHITSQPTTLLHLTPQATSWHQNRSHHHHGTAEGSFTAKKWFGHRAGWSSWAHSIGKFCLCYTVPFSSETSAPGSPGNYLYIDITLSACTCLVLLHFAAFFRVLTNKNTSFLCDENSEVLPRPPLHMNARPKPGLTSIDIPIVQKICRQRTVKRENLILNLFLPPLHRSCAGKHVP